MSESELDKVLTQRHGASQAIVDVEEATIKLVVFELAQQDFAFRSEGIREVLGHATVFFVPGCPPSLEGVINVRGDIESVIRLNDLLHLPASAGNQNTPILLGRGKEVSSGIRVDRVLDVIDVVESSIQPPPSTQPEYLLGLVAGLLNFQGRPVTLLDLNQVFTRYAGGLG